jgi:hypothetical protein
MGRHPATRPSRSVRALRSAVAREQAAEAAAVVTATVQRDRDGAPFTRTVALMWGLLALPSVAPCPGDQGMVAAVGAATRRLAQLAAAPAHAGLAATLSTAFLEGLCESPDAPPPPPVRNQALVVDLITAACRNATHWAAMPAVLAWACEAPLQWQTLEVAAAVVQVLGPQNVTALRSAVCYMCDAEPSAVYLPPARGILRLADVVTDLGGAACAAAMLQPWADARGVDGRMGPAVHAAACVRN